MRIKSALATVLLMGALLPANIAPAGAQSSSDIDSYMRLLQNRITSGQRSGKLTSRETQNLQKDFGKISNDYANIGRGRSSNAQRQEVMSKLSNLDRKIWDKLHDDNQSRWRNWDDNRKTWRQPPNWGANQNWGPNNNFNRPANQFNNGKNQAKNQPKNPWRRTGGNQQNVPQEPPRWMVSRDGGYYDATGSIQGTVPGNQLFQYGGLMGDGSPLPGPGSAVNAHGHLIR